MSQYSSSFQALLENAQVHEVGRGETIVTTENLHGIFCVKKGFVKRYLIENDGSISVQGIYGPGDCFGIPALSRFVVKDYAYNGSETYYYESINNVVVCEIDNKTLLNILPSKPELYKDFFIIQGWHSLSDVWHLESMGLENASKRVAHIICYYMERYGTQTRRGMEFKVPFVQQDLADILNLSRETVSISINDLKKQKLLKKNRKIVVSSLPKLKAYSYS